MIPLISSGIYAIRSVGHNTQVVASNDKGQAVGESDKCISRQGWSVKNISGDICTIQNIVNRRYLAVSGIHVSLADKPSNWDIVWENNGHWKVQANGIGTAWTLPSGKDGEPIILKNYSGASDQLWVFQHRDSCLHVVEALITYIARLFL